MANSRFASRVLIIAVFLMRGISAHTQSASPPVDPAISRLAVHLAELLQKAHEKKVVFVDLQGPEGESHPVGKYLADKLSEFLRREFPNLEVIGSLQPETNSNDHGNPEDKAAAIEKTKAWARKLGANVVITGSFAKVSQGIGVSLSPLDCRDSRKWLGLATGLIPTTDEIDALSPDPIPSPTIGIARAGVGGNTAPTCVSCPDPTYSSAARAAKYEGIVLLDVVVSAQGRAEQIKIVKGPGLGLDENAINTVKKWKFKPALGPDGNPVAVLVPIQVTFRLR